MTVREARKLQTKFPAHQPDKSRTEINDNKAIIPSCYCPDLHRSDQVFDRLPIIFDFVNRPFAGSCFQV
jgi:hypothetical protein